MFIMVFMERKSEDKKLKTLYMRSYFKGRSRFAQWADRAFFAVLICLAVYLIARSFRVRASGARLAGSAAGIGFFIVSCIAMSLRIDAHAAAKRAEAGIELARRRMLLGEASALDDIIQDLNSAQEKRAFALIRKATPIDEDDVCRAVREFSSKPKQAGSLALIVLNEPPSRVREFAERIKRPRIEFVSFTAVSALFDRCRASDEEITEELLLQTKKRPPRLTMPSAEALFKGAGKYRVLGLTLLAASFVMRFSFYARTLGMLSIASSFALGAGERIKLRRARGA